jgi:hypothetical protein
MSRSIKEILSLLSASDLATLRYAFEHEISNTFVVYEPGRFVGVHIRDSLRTLQIEQRAGLYAAGILRAVTNGDATHHPGV